LAGPLGHHFKERSMRSEIMTRVAEVYAAQADGGPPTTLVAGSAPGETGVSVLGVRYDGGMHFQAAPRWHCICFQMSPVRVERRMVGGVVRHEPPVGSLAISPAGSDCAADADDTVETLLVAIDTAWFALAATEGSERQARLIECFWAYDDSLLALARSLAFESGEDYPNGPLFWNEVAARFIDRLVARHTTELPIRARGMLSDDVLKRIKDYIVANLDEPIEVAALAGIAARSPFHFTRLFTQSVGLTPHRYVVHLRLQRAIELVRDGRSGLAEIAARTGFADQSHLSRWIRRVLGVSPTQLAA
jgi:AraC family transcriptional regulator